MGGIVYADKPYQPGEEPRFEIQYTPGVVIAADDSLTGAPTVAVYRMPEMTDVTAEVTGPPLILAVLKGTASRSGNSVFVQLQNLVNGTKYDVQCKCGTTNGEANIEIDLIVSCVSYP